MHLFRPLAAVFAILLAVSGCGHKTTAADGPASLAGETIELIVPFAPGGGYDAYARQLAPKLGEELQATVIVVNKPGAGGVLATNEIWKADPDGTTIALFNTPGHLGSALAQSPGVRYDAEAFSYIGRLSSEPDVVLTAKDSAYHSWNDVEKKRGNPPV